MPKPTKNLIYRCPTCGRTKKQSPWLPVPRCGGSFAKWLHAGKRMVLDGPAQEPVATKEK